MATSLTPNCDHEEGDIYIGSTTKQYLSQRMDAHRGKYDIWLKGHKRTYVSVFDLFQKYKIENCKIYLIELFPCNTRDELLAKEGHYIKTMKCVNKIVAGQSPKEYYEANKTKINEKKKVRA